VGSVAGSVSYLPVPENPRLQDVVVQPSVTVVENADGSKNMTYSAVVPVGRKLNGQNSPERFRVEAGTPMREVRHTVLVAAPTPPPQGAEPPAQWAEPPAERAGWQPSAEEPAEAGAPSSALSKVPRVNIPYDQAESTSNPEPVPPRDPAPQAQPPTVAPGLQVPDWMGPAVGAVGGALGAGDEVIRFITNPLGAPQS